MKRTAKTPTGTEHDVAQEPQFDAAERRAIAVALLEARASIDRGEGIPLDEAVARIRAGRARPEAK